MEISKYNKLEKLGFTFWAKRHDDEIQLESYLIGGSAVAICSFSNLGFNLIERERFIRSMAYFLNHDTVEKINTEEVVKTGIKTAFFFRLLFNRNSRRRLYKGFFASFFKRYLQLS